MGQGGGGVPSIAGGAGEMASPAKLEMRSVREDAVGAEEDVFGLEFSAEVCVGCGAWEGGWCFMR